MNDDKTKTPAGMELKSVNAKIEVKAVGDDGICHIKAYGCAFGNIDSWGDIILPTALDEFLASEDAARMALCWQHDFATVIGKITDKGVDDYGMWFEADILPTTVGKDAAILLKAGAIDEFSIGYRADKWHYEKRDGYADDIRILDAITIYEVSPVTRAANDKAILLDAKNDPAPAPDPEPEPAPDPAPADPQPDPAPAPTEENEDKHQKPTEMEEKDIKAMVDAKAAEMQTIIDEQKTAIDNLDKTIQDQQKTIEDLKAPKAQKTWFGAFQAAVKAHEPELRDMLTKQAGSIKFEFEHKTELTTGDITNYAYGVALDATVSAARLMKNAFYDAFPKDIVNANQFNWLDGSFSDAAGYVAEMAAPGDDDATVTEKSRKFAKVAAHLGVSSEVADFFEVVYNWARNTAMAKILAYVDTEICAGAGVDVTYPNKVYGLTANNTQYTAFSATGAKYSNATIADVILDGQAQAMAAGYTIDKAFVTWAEYAQIRGLKTENGTYLFNEITGLLNGVQIIPTSKLSSGEVLLVDSSVVRIKERPTWEFEVVRNAKLDGWDVYVRKSVQVLVKANEKAGVIYVSSLSTALAAITEASSLATIASAVNASGQIETHPNS